MAKIALQHWRRHRYSIYDTDTATVIETAPGPASPFSGFIAWALGGKVAVFLDQRSVVVVQRGARRVTLTEATSVRHWNLGLCALGRVKAPSGASSLALVCRRTPHLFLALIDPMTFDEIDTWDADFLLWLADLDRERISKVWTPADPD